MKVVSAKSEEFIKVNYISKIMALLQGDSGALNERSGFTKALSKITDECDNEDMSYGHLQLFKKILAEYFDEHVIPKMQNQTSEGLLTELCKQWKSLTIFSMLVSRLFDYVDRHYVRSICGEPLGRQCQRMFQMRIVDGLETQITNAINDQIERDRRDENINRNVIKDVI